MPNGVAFFYIFGIIVPIMLMIRLQRVGRKNDPSFRVVITEKANAAKSGAFLEVVGSYDARKDRVQLKPDRIQHWLSHGAKASATVHNILVNAKVINAPKVNALPSKKSKPEEAKTEAPAPAQKTEEMAPVTTVEAKAEETTKAETPAEGVAPTLTAGAPTSPDASVGEEKKEEVTA